MFHRSSSYTEFRDRSKYPTTISPAPFQYGTVAEVFALFFKHFAWSTVTFIKDQDGMKPLWESIMVATEARLRRDQLSFVLLTVGSRVHRTTDSEIEKALKYSANRSRGNAADFLIYNRWFN